MGPKTLQWLLSIKKQFLFNSKTSINTSSIEITSPNTASPLENSLSEFYIEKLKISEASNAKIKKYYSEKIEIEIEFGKDEKGKRGLRKKVANLSAFIEKQQTFIVKYGKVEKD